MGRLFDRAYAPSTLGSFLRGFAFGHVRQLDAVATRFLTALAGQAPLVPVGGDGRVLVDVDDTVIEVTATPSMAPASATPGSAA
jgi:hypothetical protein